MHRNTLVTLAAALGSGLPVLGQTQGGPLARFVSCEVFSDNTANLYDVAIVNIAQFIPLSTLCSEFKTEMSAGSSGEVVTDTDCNFRIGSGLNGVDTLGSIDLSWSMSPGDPNKPFNTIMAGFESLLGPNPPFMTNLFDGSDTFNCTVLTTDSDVPSKRDLSEAVVATSTTLVPDSAVKLHERQAGTPIPLRRGSTIQIGARAMTVKAITISALGAVPQLPVFSSTSASTLVNEIQTMANALGTTGLNLASRNAALLGIGTDLLVGYDSSRVQAAFGQITLGPNDWVSILAPLVDTLFNQYVHGNKAINAVAAVFKFDGDVAGATAFQLTCSLLPAGLIGISAQP